MNYQAAISKAVRQAKSSGGYFYVFREEDGYEVGTENDAETYYFGERPVAVATPEGDVDTDPEMIGAGCNEPCDGPSDADPGL